MSRRKQLAFQRLIAPMLARLFSAAYRLTGNVPDAEDLVQDACVTAGERLDELARMEYPDRWLLRVLYNRFVDRARRLARAPVVNLHDGFESPEGAPPDAAGQGLDDLTDRERAFCDACAKLSDSQRALLSLRAEGYALPEIAEIIGIDSHVLRGRLHRARVSLARHLNEGMQADGIESRLGSRS